MSLPEEMFAWIFSAGVPDPRGEQYPFQPMIPAPCFAAFSKLLYDFGCRFHPELQTLWVKPASGPLAVLKARGVAGIEQDVAAMLVDQFPEKAAELLTVTPENRSEALKKQAQELLDSIERLKAAQAGFEGGDVG